MSDACCTVFPETQLTYEETMLVLERYFRDSLEIWKNALKIDAPPPNEAYVRAIRDIPLNYPHSLRGRKLDKDFLDEFRLSCFKECYGDGYADAFLLCYPRKGDVLLSFQARADQEQKEAVVEAAAIDPAKIKIVEVTLLSREEYDVNKDLIPPKEVPCWLRDPCEDGRVYLGYVFHCRSIERLIVGFYAGVCPALRYEEAVSCFEPGKTVLLKEQSYTVLRGGLLLKDKLLANQQKVAFRTDPRVPDANLYEMSDVKKMVDEWSKNEFGIC